MIRFIAIMGLASLLLIGCQRAASDKTDARLQLRADPPAVEPGGAYRLWVVGQGQGALRWSVSAGKVRRSAPGVAEAEAPRSQGAVTVTVRAAGSDGPILGRLQLTVRRHRPPGKGPCGGLVCPWITTVMEPHQAPPLQRPRAVSRAAAHGLAPDHRVLGLTINGHTRAYPLNLLAYHRVVNDRLAGRDLLVAFSPLSGSRLCALWPTGLAYSGKIYENDDLLEGPDGTLWSVMLGRAVKGAGIGRRAQVVPCAVMSWSAWQRMRPQTDVVWPEEPVLGFDYSRDPWAWYRQDPEYMVTPPHYVDLRHGRKAEVLGLVRGGVARVYPLSGPRSALNHRFNGAEVLVLRDPAAGFGAAFLRRVSGQSEPLTFELDSANAGPLTVRDRQTHSRWDALGEAIDGPLKGRRLTPVEGGPALFFAWAAFFQGSELYLEDSNNSNMLNASGGPATRLPAEEKRR